MRRLLWATLGVLPLLAACAAGTGDPVGDAPTDAPESAAPSDAAPSIGPIGDVPAEMIEEVLALAASDSGVDPAEIEIVSAEAVTWSDGSLGCPEEGMMYTQALVPGYRVVVDVAGEEVHYHASEAGDFTACADPQEPVEGGSADR